MLLVAVGVHGTALGLAMIVALSPGLAVILVGLVLATARLGGGSAGWEPERLARPADPPRRAVVVAALGLAMAMGGATSLASR